MNYPISGAVFTIAYAFASPRMRRWMTIGMLSMLAFFIGIDKSYDDVMMNTQYSLSLLSWLAIIVFVANAWTYPEAVRANREHRRMQRAIWYGYPYIPTMNVPPPSTTVTPTRPQRRLPTAAASPPPVFTPAVPLPDPTTAPAPAPTGPTLWTPRPSKQIRRQFETDTGIKTADRRAVDPETL